MDEIPPRRSRRPSDSRKDTTFPLIPFLIGVVVLGFVIGAGLSMAGHHGAKQQVAVAPEPTREPTATPGPTLAPLATPRRAASETPDLRSPVPIVTRTVAARVKPSTKAGAHVALASLPPSPEASAPANVASAAPPVGAVPATPKPEPVRTHAQTIVAVRTAAAAASTTAAPIAASASPAAAATAAPQIPVPATPAPASIEADTEFGRLSANVVKQYLRALARGDTESASGAFVPGASNSYPERDVLDSTAQIGTISSRGSNDVQTVNARITNSGGTYLGTYTVHRTQTGAAVIVSHTISKS